MNGSNLEKEIIKELKKYEKDRDNIIGIIYELRDSKDYESALIKMSIYLNNPSTSKTRNDLIEYAEKISQNT